MTSTDKFLKALEGRHGHTGQEDLRSTNTDIAPLSIPVSPGPAPPETVTDIHPQDAAADGATRIQTRTPTQDRAKAHDHDLNYQFLTQARIAAYLQYLENSPSQYLSGFDVYDPHHDWDSDDCPLGLCEFLAYKSGLAYYTSAAIEKNLRQEHPPGISDYRFFASRIRRAHTQGYGFVLGETAYLVFRGTEFFTWADWATDFDSVLTTDLDDARYERERDLIGPRAPGRHTGFAIAWGSVRDSVVAWAEDLLDSGRAKRIVFSGHSLGGALAKIAAHHFASELHRAHQIGAVITFGAPLVGDGSFKESYENEFGLGRRTIRLEASLDLITMLTLSPFSYDHVGRSWHLNKRPAYSRWRMYFFTPLIDPEDEAEKKAKVKQKRQVEPKTAEKPFKNQLYGYLLSALWFTIRLMRRAEAAHSVNRRYALYLSVLSYQSLRRHFSDDYESAYARLQNHLAYIRGRNGKLFGVAKTGPIKIKSRSDEERLQNYFKHFIV